MFYIKMKTFKIYSSCMLPTISSNIKKDQKKKKVTLLEKRHEYKATDLKSTLIIFIVYLGHNYCHFFSCNIWHHHIFY